MGQWFEQPEDSREIQYFSAKDPRPWWKDALVLAVAWALIAAGVLVAAMLAGCVAQPRSRAWRASLTVEYANGQRITAADAASPDWRIQGADKENQK